jgi:hypothetical protein
MSNSSSFYPSQDIILENEPFSALSSPLIGTYVFDYAKLCSKIDNCGLKFDEYFPPDGGESKILAIFCDNRVCDNSACKDHRLYKYMRLHREQIDELRKSMYKPKAWVFTGWVIPVSDFSRSFAQEKLVFLFRILKSSSVSEFSIHMELKVYPAGHKHEGCFYLHFHVVSAGFKDLRFIRKRWGRQIRYEEAICPDDLGYYVSKYASKTPFFADDRIKFFYARIVYKLQMHRFSVGHSTFIPSGWVSLSSLEREVRACLYKDSYLNPDSSKRYFYKFLEPSVDKPPPQKVKNDLIWRPVPVPFVCNRVNHSLEEYL